MYKYNELTSLFKSFFFFVNHGVRHKYGVLNEYISSLRIHEFFCGYYALVLHQPSKCIVIECLFFGKM